VTWERLHDGELATGSTALRDGGVTAPSHATLRRAMPDDVDRGSRRHLDFTEISALVSRIVAATAAINLYKCFLARGAPTEDPVGNPAFRCHQLHHDDSLPMWRAFVRLVWGRSLLSPR
jgi:hypothetical protein